ncbi:MAG TPA: hydroxymethylbilane synthase [Sphingomicrobium sp.]|nr:hydroxymethylbilane synthase [Sphingomicrobium sp.]
MPDALKLGTRGSPLALAQAHLAAAAIALANGWDGSRIEIVPVTTTGDRVQDRPLSEIGGKALWTKELDRALAAGEVDFCVHSMKDVESDRPAEFAIAAILPRADVRDRLIGAGSIAALRDGAIVGTSSPRRAAQLLGLRPDLQIVPFRGNVESRLRKVREGEVDASLLAAAGLERLGIHAGAAISVDQMLPAPGQAAIGIECRSGDFSVLEALDAANCRDSYDCVLIERAFTRALGGTCASPVAALAELAGERVSFKAALFSADGRDWTSDERILGRTDADGAAALASAMLGRSPASVRQLFESA